MHQDPEALIVLFVDKAKSLAFRSVHDGAVVAEVPLGHTLISGTSRDDMIVTVGQRPDSLIIIRDRHAPEKQQLVALSCYPVGVAISPTLDTIAVMLNDGLTICIAPPRHDCELI